MSNLSAYRANVLDAVSCPACHSPMGIFCRSLEDSALVEYIHDDRSEAYDRYRHGVTSDAELFRRAAISAISAGVRDHNDRADDATCKDVAERVFDRLGPVLFAPVSRIRAAFPEVETSHRQGEWTLNLVATGTDIEIVAIQWMMSLLGFMEQQAGLGIVTRDRIMRYVTARLDLAE